MGAAGVVDAVVECLRVRCGDGCHEMLDYKNIFII